MTDPYFSIDATLPGTAGRAGVIHTPHGDIQTPAFIAVGTKATVKAVLPETMAALGAQAVLANAYHLYLQPGPDIVDEAGGLGAFMNWPGPTFTDSGGFQVLSLGSGVRKVMAMDVNRARADDVTVAGKDKLAHVDDDGVTFTSHLDGSAHRFTPEVSMQIQHQLGADIMFAFDELTTLINTREYQEDSVQRTHEWAQRCLDEHEKLTRERADKPYQALFGVVQGAQYEDLRRQAARGLESLAGGAQCERQPRCRELGPAGPPPGDEHRCTRGGHQQTADDAHPGTEGVAGGTVQLGPAGQHKKEKKQSRDQGESGMAAGQNDGRRPASGSHCPP